MIKQIKSIYIAILIGVCSVFTFGNIALAEDPSNCFVPSTGTQGPIPIPYPNTGMSGKSSEDDTATVDIQVPDPGSNTSGSDSIDPGSVSINVKTSGKPVGQTSQ